MFMSTFIKSVFIHHKHKSLKSCLNPKVYLKKAQMWLYLVNTYLRNPVLISTIIVVVHYGWFFSLLFKVKWTSQPTDDWPWSWKLKASFTRRWKNVCVTVHVWDVTYLRSSRSISALSPDTRRWTSGVENMCNHSGLMMLRKPRINAVVCSLICVCILKCAMRWM